MNTTPEDRLSEHVLSSEQVFDGRLLKLYRDKVRLPDGTTAQREYIRHPGAVVIVAVLEDGRIIFERQFRYPLRRTFIELPAGKIDQGESSEVCAQRELREETGYVAAKMQHLGVMHPCIGYSDECIDIFLAHDLHQQQRQLDEGEFIEVLTLDIDAAEQAVLQGEITDGKTIAALFLALPALKQLARG